MEKWEYKIELFTFAPLTGVMYGVDLDATCATNESRLNQLGEQGWELVGTGSTRDAGLYLILKRRKR